MATPNVLVVSKRQKKLQESLKQQGYIIIDVTSTSTDLTFRKFSPFYPHGNIPVPGTNTTAQSVEGIWQGLKVFEREGVDPSKFAISNMKNIKRATGDKRGKVLGHQFGSSETLNYILSRKQIYIPSYNYVLHNMLHNEISLLRGLLHEGNKLALLDYETNEDVNDTSKPLSHASLIKALLT